MRVARRSARGSLLIPGRTMPSRTTARELRLQPPLVVTCIAAGSHLGRPRASGAREAILRPARARPTGGVRGGRRDARRPGRRALGLTASGATCVQRLDGSRDSAIHTKYRISLRSSSMREPRYPLPRVVMTFERRLDARRAPADGATGRPALRSVFLGAFRARGSLARTARARARASGKGSRRAVARHADRPSVRERVRGLLLRASTMILPQVHLRKPCYDFSFL